MIENKIASIENPKSYILISFLLILTYLWIFEQFFPNNAMELGHDYYFCFTRMLSGYYWFKENGLTEIPYFTPALCAGNVFFTDPQNSYFSFPQFLMFLVNPITSVWLTTAVFAIAGLTGACLLFRKVFLCSLWGAILGGALFLFNGFYIYRIIIGHLTYHGFMLLPVIVLFLLWNKRQNMNILGNLACAISAAFLFSYIFYSGGIHLIVPMALSIAAAAMIYGLTRGTLKHFWIRIPFFAIFLFLFIFPKLSVSIFTLKNLARDGYSLCGIPDIANSLWVPFKTLFFKALTWNESKEILENKELVLGSHEFEFGITFIPLLLIGIGTISLFRSYLKGNVEFYKKTTKRLYSVFLVLILFTPIVFNFYTPAWNDILKQIPIAKNSITLVRWYSAYILPAILVSILVFERICRNKTLIRTIFGILLICMVVILNIVYDKSYYHTDSYNPEPILVGYKRAKQYNHIPYIEYIDHIVRVENMLIRDDAMMIFGVSHIGCYESLLGYQHEFFPKKDMIRRDRFDSLKNGYFNMKNPACYTFPEVNFCEPGDHFREDQREALNNFVRYRPFEFNLPAIQKIANIVAPISIIGSLIFLISYPFIKKRRKKI